MNVSSPKNKSNKILYNAHRNSEIKDLTEKSKSNSLTPNKAQEKYPEKTKYCLVEYQQS